MIPARVSPFLVPLHRLLVVEIAIEVGIGISGLAEAINGRSGSAIALFVICVLSGVLVQRHRWRKIRRVPAHSVPEAPALSVIESFRRTVVRAFVLDLPSILLLGVGAYYPVFGGAVGGIAIGLAIPRLHRLRRIAQAEDEDASRTLLEVSPRLLRSLPLAQIYMQRRGTTESHDLDKRFP